MLIQDHVQDLVYIFLYTLYCINSFLFGYVYISDILWLSQIDADSFAGCHFGREKKSSNFLRSLFFNVKFWVKLPTAPKSLGGWYLHWMLGTLSINLLFCFLKQVWPSKFIKWSSWVSQWRVGRFIRFNTRWRSEDYSHPLCQRCDLWQSVSACVFDFVCMCVKLNV